MRYILGLCAVLAVGNTAWTSEMGTIAGEPGYQTPAATVTSTVNQATGTPVTATSPAGVVQTMATQPGATNMSPAPAMMSPGTYTVGTQPVATYATPMGNTVYTTNSYPTYTTNSYPMRMGGGLFGMRRRIYTYPATTPVTTTYTAPAQTYTVMPGQTYYYQPVRPRMGLFQRLRQQFTPMSAAPTYGTPTYYSASGYAAPAYTTYATPAYDTTTYAAQATTIPAGTTTTAGTTPGSTAPVYTPTTLDVPNNTPATTTSAPAEPPLQGTVPAQSVPTIPGTGQAAPSSVPGIPQSKPR